MNWVYLRRCENIEHIDPVRLVYGELQDKTYDCTIYDLKFKHIIRYLQTNIYHVPTRKFMALETSKAHQ